MELQSSQHFTCAPSGMGLGARVGGCSHKDWEPLACQTPELQSPKLSMELQRLSTVGEVATGSALRVQPDTVVGSEPKGLRALD